MRRIYCGLSYCRKYLLLDLRNKIISYRIVAEKLPSIAKSQIIPLRNKITSCCSLRFTHFYTRGRNLVLFLFQWTMCFLHWSALGMWNWSVNTWSLWIITAFMCVLIFFFYLFHSSSQVSQSSLFIRRETVDMRSFIDLHINDNSSLDLNRTLFIRCCSTQFLVPV